MNDADWLRKRLRGRPPGCALLLLLAPARLARHGARALIGLADKRRCKQEGSPPRAIV